MQLWSSIGHCNVPWILSWLRTVFSLKMRTRFSIHELIFLQELISTTTTTHPIFLLSLLALWISFSISPCCEAMTPWLCCSHSWVLSTHPWLGGNKCPAVGVVGLPGAPYAMTGGQLRSTSLPLPDWGVCGELIAMSSVWVYGVRWIQCLSFIAWWWCGVVGGKLVSMDSRVAWSSLT